VVQANVQQDAGPIARNDILVVFVADLPMAAL
jgi:hypothetical protein